MVINEGEIGGGDSIQYLFWNERERVHSGTSKTPISWDLNLFSKTKYYFYAEHRDEVLNTPPYEDKILRFLHTMFVILIKF